MKKKASSGCFPAHFGVTDLNNVLHLQDAAVIDGVWHRGGDSQQELSLHIRRVRTDGMSSYGGHGMGNKSPSRLVVGVKILFLQQLHLRGHCPR